MLELFSAGFGVGRDFALLGRAWPWHAAAEHHEREDDPKCAGEREHVPILARRYAGVTSACERAPLTRVSGDGGATAPAPVVVDDADGAPRTTRSS